MRSSVKRLLRFFRCRSANAMAETAVVLPVVLVLTFALVNFAIAGYASTAAANAANYGARVGSVAAAAANASLSKIGIGEYSVSASGGGGRGAQVLVNVNWSVPNYIGSLLSLLGGGSSVEFKGSVQSTFRQEGW